MAATARERVTAEGETHSGDLAEFGSLPRSLPRLHLPDAVLGRALLLLEYGDHDEDHRLLWLHLPRDAVEDHRSYAAELLLAREVGRDLLDQSGRDLGSFLKRMAGK